MPNPRRRLSPFNTVCVLVLSNDVCDFAAGVDLNGGPAPCSPVALLPYPVLIILVPTVFVTFGYGELLAWSLPYDEEFINTNEAVLLSEIFGDKSDGIVSITVLSDWTSPVGVLAKL